MGVEELVNKIQSNFNNKYESISRTITTGISYNDEGEVESTNITVVKGPETTKDIINLLIRAILEEIKINGIEMGDSTATKLEVK